MRRTLIALAGSVLCLGSASAQDVYVDDETYVVEEPTVGVVEEDGVVVDDGDVVVGPRVYGWEAVRPDDCGTYNYWNGEYCADAREEPPVEDFD